MSDNSHKIKAWFYDEFENIIDEVLIMNDIRNELLSLNDEEFSEEIDLQSYDEFVRSVSITCSSKLGLSYDEVYDSLENKLEELYNAFD